MLDGGRRTLGGRRPCGLLRFPVPPLPSAISGFFLGRRLSALERAQIVCRVPGCLAAYRESRNLSQHYHEKHREEDYCGMIIKMQKMEAAKKKSMRRKESGGGKDAMEEDEEEEGEESEKDEEDVSGEDEEEPEPSRPVKRRRPGCRCSWCQAADCGACRSCLNQKRKKKCEQRQCVSLVERIPDVRVMVAAVHDAEPMVDMDNRARRFQHRRGKQVEDEAPTKKPEEEAPASGMASGREEAMGRQEDDPGEGTSGSSHAIKVKHELVDLVDDEDDEDGLELRKAKAHAKLVEELVARGRATGVEQNRLEEMGRAMVQQREKVAKAERAENDKREELTACMAARR